MAVWLQNLQSTDSRAELSVVPRCARHTTLPSNRMGGGLDATWQWLSVLCTLTSPRWWFRSFFPWAYIAHSASFAPSSHWSKVSVPPTPHFHPSFRLQMDRWFSLLSQPHPFSPLSWNMLCSRFLKTRLKKRHFIPHTRCIFILYLPLLAKLVRKVYTGVSDSILGCSFTCKGFPGDSDGKESACNARDPGLIPGSGRYPGEGNANLL